MPQDSFSARFAVDSHRWARPEDLQSAMLYRGVIVSAWAQVDAIVSEVLLRCNRMGEYEGAIPDKYPGDRRIRLRLLQRICRAPGPMRRGRRAVLFAMRSYRRADAIRHLVAHCGMRIVGPGLVQFSDWPKGQGPAQLRLQVVRIADLEADAEQWARFARGIGRLLFTGARRLDLPTLEQCEE